MDELDVKRESMTLVKWKLANFSTVAARDDPEKRLFSKFFKLDSSTVKCYLKFDPTNKKKDGDRNYSSLFLVVRDFAGQSTIKLRYSFWIENELGEKMGRRLKESERVFKKSTAGWGNSKFVNHNRLYSLDNQFVQNDVIFLCCRIVCEDVLPSEFNHKIWMSYEEGFTGECILKVSGEELKVSKTLLVAHSPVFKSMFSLNTQEAATGIVEIEGIKANTMKALIEYLHTESVTNLDKIALEVFKAADMYCIDGLMTQCVKSLTKNLSKDTLFDCLILAFMHEAKDLKKAVLDFIESSEDGIFAEIISSDNWIDFAAQNKKRAKQITTEVFEKLNFKY